MKNRLVQAIPALVILLTLSFSYFSFWCTNYGQPCYRTWLDGISLDITNPLYFFALYLLPLTIVLIFIPPRIFKIWLKFAWLALLVVLFLIFTTPTTNGGFSLLPSPDRDQVARSYAIVFSIISLALIIWKYAALRSNKNQP